MVQAERTLCYASDYPHANPAEPGKIFADVPAALRSRIFRDNALETFGARLSVPARRT